MPQSLEPPRAGQRPIVGVLVDWLEQDYQVGVLRGMVREARENDVSLMVFAGGAPQTELGMGAVRNYLFDLVGPANVDALVVSTTALPLDLNEDAQSAFFARFGGLPIVGLGITAPDIPGIFVEQEHGMHEALAHLVATHGHRRLAFIAGPLGSLDAEQRWRSFQSGLKEAGLEVDPRLVVRGNFQVDGGASAIHELFDERRVEPASIDAIVAANDAMALGAISALERRGIRVPEQIAIIGFDDIESARYASPPLSTVRQPIEEQGRLAIRKVLGLLGRPPDSRPSYLPFPAARGPVGPSTVPPRESVATRFITRRSCGCRTRGRSLGLVGTQSKLPRTSADPVGSVGPSAIGASQASASGVSQAPASGVSQAPASLVGSMPPHSSASLLDVQPSRFGLEAALVERRSVILAELSRAARGALFAAGPGWEARMLQALVSEVRGDAPDAFLAFFDDLLRRLSAGPVTVDPLRSTGLPAKPDLEACQEVLSALRRQILPCTAREPDRRAIVHELIDSARVLLAIAAERLEGQRRLELQRDARAFSEAAASLLTAGDDEALAAAMNNYLPRLGVEASAVALFADMLGGDATVDVLPSRRRLRLLQGFDPDGAFSFAPDYAATELIPDQRLRQRRHVSIVLPLRFRSLMLGLVVIEYGPRMAPFLEQWRQLLSAALLGTALPPRARLG